jgi:O-antigen ligase
MSLLSLMPKKKMVLKFIKTEKFLTFFIIWSFLTVFWSDYPFISFKRWLQIVGTVIIFLAALLHFRSTDEAISYIRAILSIYLLLSLISIIFIPGAIQLEFPAWRGIAPHKNMLGQVSLIGIIVWTFAIWHANSKKRLTAFFFLVLSCLLLLGSRSTTSILAGMALLILIGLFYAEKHIVRPVTGSVFSFIFFLLFFLGLAYFAYLIPDCFSYLFKLFGKESTLTGRTELWSILFEEIQKHFIHGYGFGGYWVLNNPLHGVIFEKYFLVHNQAHNGYIDILNETGMVGLSTVVLMVVFYFKNLSNYEKPYLLKWFIFAALILNITESTLFVPNALTGVLFTFSYVVLYTELIQQD